MDKQTQNTQSPKPARLKIVIIVLAILLTLSAGGLAFRYIYLHFWAPAQSTAIVPDNLIGDESSRSEEGAASAESGEASEPTEGESDSSGLISSDYTTVDKPTAKVLELYQGRPEDNRRFEVKNMLPGDTETKYFCVRAHHNADLELFFKADITEQTKNLADVLHIKVTHPETGKVLCDAPFSEVNGKEFSELLKANGDKVTTAYYQIDVSLDTAVGNEYQAAALKADFKWYVKDEGALTPPQTGDTTNLILWITLAVSSLLLILFLLLGKRRKEARHERTE